jgi:hypothetical protein
VRFCFTHRVQIDVPSAAFRSGALLELGVCARHGTPMTRARWRRFTTEAPGVIVLLAFFSFFVVLLVAAAFQKDVRGQLPECEACHRTHRRRVRAMWTGIAGALGCVASAAVWEQGSLFLAGVLLLIGGVVSGVRADVARVRGTLQDELTTVRLRGVDRAFAAAVSRRVEHAPEPDPWVTPRV